MAGASLVSQLRPELACAETLQSTESSEDQRFFKAVKIGMVRTEGSLEEKLALLKELGFDGVELTSPTNLKVEEVQAASRSTGLPVHGVVDSIHWKQRLSDPDATIRRAGREGLETALRDAKAFGGSSVLLVPGRVVDGVSVEDCWNRSIEQIHAVLPLAARLGIFILIENVWNDFITEPEQFARYLDEINSPWVGAYFDIGNTVRFSPPHEWIPILGRRIVKLDIKDYGAERGFKHKLLEGDVDWPKVMSALKEIGFTGWATAEIPGGGRDRLTEIAARMDQIFAC